MKEPGMEPGENGAGEEPEERRTEFDRDTPPTGPVGEGVHSKANLGSEAEPRAKAEPAPETGKSQADARKSQANVDQPQAEPGKSQAEPDKGQAEREKGQVEGSEGSLVTDERRRKRAQRTLAGVLAALFAAILMYKVLHAGHLEQTAVFYVGIPAVIAITIAFSRPRSTTGLIMSTITIGLALAGPLLGEGIVCLFFAAPLFYAVGLLIGLLVDWERRNSRRGLNVIVVPLLLLAVSEGVTDTTSLPRWEEVSATVPVGGVDVERTLSAPPTFAPYAALFLHLGFPRPLWARGQGLQVGATREIAFTPRRSLGIGALPEPRSMTLRVAERYPGRVVFQVVRDTTLARWMDLRQADFTWTSNRLTVTLRYRRTFDPAWYFGPLQKYATGQAAAYLAETFAR
jgi:hypothetical protein